MQGAKTQDQITPATLSYQVAFVQIAGRLFTSSAERRHSLEVRAGLMRLLYSHVSNLFIVGFAGLLTGVYAYVRHNDIAVFLIATVGFILLLIRCGMVKYFQNLMHRGYVLDPERWMVGFGLTGCASSCCWGAVSFCCLAFSHDPVLYLVSVVFTTATAASIAARNAPAPRIARLQLTLSLLPIVAGAPLADDGGYLFLDLAVPALLYGLSSLISEINKHFVELYSSQAKLRELSNTDHLTQIANRRHFGECFSATLASRHTSLQPVTVLMIDVDYFKGYNDHYGHPAGDRCLQDIAQRLQFSLRYTDSLVSRYGGEEFAVMLRDTCAAKAAAIAQRLCSSIADAGIPHANRKDEGETVTISVGIATTDRLDVSCDEIITSADRALYLAKTLGRNRISAATERDQAAATAGELVTLSNPGPFEPGLTLQSI